MGKVRDLLKWQAKNTSLPEKTYIWFLAVVLFGVVLHAPLSVGLGEVWPDAALVVKSWKELLLGLAALLLVVILTTKKQWKVLHTPLVYIAAGFTVLHLLLVPVFYTGLQATLAALLINLRFVVMFILVYAAVRLLPKTKNFFISVAAAGVLIVAAFGVLQVTVLPKDILSHIGYSDATIKPYQTIDENDDYVRINSTLRGPNPLGAYMVIVLSLVVAVYAGARQKFAPHWYWLLSAVGMAALVVLWFSYSRSALVAAVAAMGLTALLVYGRYIHKWIWFGVVAAGLLLAGGLVAAKDTHFVSHVLLHEDPNEGGDINSNDMHHLSLTIGVDRMLEQPLGGGVGSTGSASLFTPNTLIIENQYLFIAHEVGWLGLALFLILFIGVLWQLWVRRADWLSSAVLASGLGLAAIGMVLPVWVDDTVAITWWALAAVALAVPVVRARKVAKKEAVYV